MRPGHHAATKGRHERPERADKYVTQSRPEVAIAAVEAALAPYDMTIEDIIPLLAKKKKA